MWTRVGCCTLIYVNSYEEVSNGYYTFIVSWKRELVALTLYVMRKRAMVAYFIEMWKRELGAFLYCDVEKRVGCFA